MFDPTVFNYSDRPHYWKEARNVDQVLCSFINIQSSINILNNQFIILQKNATAIFIFFNNPKDKIWERIY